MSASWIYDVFLSFSGDTRYTFTDHLLAAFERHGFSTFRDDTKLTSREEIGPGLLEAIVVSRVSIIVFSENYASLRWCLDELVKIMDCKRTLDQIVIPIFYHVDPSDVRRQTGCYAEAFANHEKRFDLESVINWRSALAEAANLTGYVLQNVDNGYESTFIETIVGRVADILNPTCLSVPEYVVGIDHHVQKLIEFLELGSNSDDVRIVAIWGIGGIGKTTIAKAIYNRIHRQFEGSSFLANVRETSKLPNGLVELQEKLLSDLLKDRHQRISSVDHGIEVIKRHTWHRRVLLVLDDVDNNHQLSALAIDRDLVCPGSRIIVTTRDSSSISSLGANMVFSPQQLSKEESLELFSWHAFRRACPVEDYYILSEEVVSYAQGIPLYLQVLGSFLSDRTVPEWIAALKKLKHIPHHDLQRKLRLSFDSLHDEEQHLFLDIACFFVGMDQDFAIKILGSCGLFPEFGIKVLSSCCLVFIDARNRLMMNDLIKDMAREIIRQESPDEPGKRSRLWYHEDVLDVLRNNTGTNSVQGLVLNLPESEELQLNAEAFTKMKRLRLLHLNYVHLSGSCKHLSKRLVWLSWKGFSSKYIPSTLIMDNLVAVDLSYSKLEQVWSGTKVLCKLKYLNLSHSYFLIETPDFTGLTSLEELLLNDCTNLVEVHQSIRYLKNLLVLNLENCKNLEKIPLSIFLSKSLINFNLSGCSKLKWPAIFQGSPLESRFSSLQLSSSIRELYMEGCNIIGSVVSLEVLNLIISNFSNLPAAISSLPLLKSLYLDRFTRLELVPARPVNLLTLFANYSTLLHNFAYHFRRNLLRYQGLGEQGGWNISLPRSEILKRCNYQSEEDVLRFWRGLWAKSEMDSKKHAVPDLYSSSTSAEGFKYDVFLSFRGSSAFTDLLYNYLVDVRVRTCHHKLSKGEEIGSELLKVIKESKISIPIFSKNYASSKWCLRELAQMVECKKTTEQLILPVFYHVEPSEVQHQSGSYEEAFHMHEILFHESTVKEWKEALREAGALKGWEVKKEADGYQGNLIETMIIPTVLLALKKYHLNVTDNLVGIDHHENEMMKLLNIGSDSVRIVGIHGMGGIGKTTMAKFIYNKLKLLKCFERYSFLADVRETVQQHNGFLSLQKQLLADTLEWRPDIADVNSGINMIKRIFLGKKVLIVLDNVNESSQFAILLGKHNQFGSGSRIIVTTRDKHVLNALGVDEFYKPLCLDDAQSLQLLSMNAFRSIDPPKDYVGISRELVSVTFGLPLALEVIGSYLSDKEEVLWEDTLKKLKKIPDFDVQKTLSISYEALNYEQRQIFLDIACFFIGMDKTYVSYMWDGCDYIPEKEIDVLCLMSLVKIGDDNLLTMHDQLRDLGREIVRRESLKNPGNRSRLWNHKEALDTLEGRRGTEKVEALSLHFELRPEKKPRFTSKEFRKLENLRYIRVDGTDLVGNFEHLLPKLRWLNWHSCPPQFKPTNFYLKNLVILDLSNSGITEDWGGWTQFKVANKLKVLQLANCALRRTPDFSSYATLEILILQRCKSLCEIDLSIGKLKNLRVLDISYTDIRKLPEEIWMLKKLEKMEIDTSSCYYLEEGVLSK